MPATIDSVWREKDTNPGAIEEALRGLLKDVHAANASYVPARVLNLVCIVDREWSGEIANRLRRVGRYHPSRTIVLAVEPGRTSLDAVATVAGPADPKPGDFALLRETIIIDCGPEHLDRVESIVDPLVVTDLLTMVWSPHGHDKAIDGLRRLAQIVLLDSVSEPDVHAALDRAGELAEELYVVDLAWLRSTPWRERIAATFDPEQLRPDLKLIDRVAVGHHPESAAAALLLVGWLASRLNWEPSPLVLRDGTRTGKAHSRLQDVAIELSVDATMPVPGLATVELSSAAGRWLRFDRGPGGLRAHYKNARGVEREWTVLGASRGEAGILGEGIRQALLRDPTYRPALQAAMEMLR